VSLKDELSLSHSHTHTHTHKRAHFLTLLPLSLFVVLTHSLSLSLTHTHFLPPLLSHPIPLVNLSLFALFFFHTLTCLPPTPPWCPRVRRRLHIPGCLAAGRRGSRPRSTKKVPSFISSRREDEKRKFPGTRKKNHRIIRIKGNRVKTCVCVCACVCVCVCERDKAH